ncbi:hypothetical protein RGCCGE502_34766 (plasmid) [Rhizobium grahamii CCGE 502]|uniref:Uncharacterized protein n=1 Tax=Rhizobium grahamii CCGE 502 TaxID=990285 RepID=S3HJ75_9HYPH|nr:hypothetical protein RGCCGE502_34766 [Rhizobium grahamii CCGE 502]
MSHFLKLASPIMSARASLHANKASRAILEKSKHLAAAKLAACKNLAGLVYTVDLEDALCEVDANYGKEHKGQNAFDWRLFLGFG